VRVPSEPGLDFYAREDIKDTPTFTPGSRKRVRGEAPSPHSVRATHTHTMELYRRIKEVTCSFQTPGPFGDDGGRDKFVAMLAEAMDVVERSLRLYRPDELSFAFNGGKDSTVVFHLLRAVTAKRQNDPEEYDAAHDPPGAGGVGDGGNACIGGVRAVLFATPNNFPEVEEFVDTTCKACVRGCCHHVWMRVMRGVHAHARVLLWLCPLSDALAGTMCGCVCVSHWQSWRASRTQAPAA